MYAKCGKVNVSLPKETDPEKLSIEEVLNLLDEKLKDKTNANLKKKKTKKRKIIQTKKTIN